MPIDIGDPDSPSWWLNRLATKLLDQKRQRRLKLLDDWFCGDPPMMPGHEAAKRALAAFLEESRSNFAELVVEAAQERMTPVGLRTSADDDETGDAEAWRIWQRAGLDIESFDVHGRMLTVGEAYVIVGDVDADSGVPLITGEDPAQVISEQDPSSPRKTLAAVKLYRDDVAAEDVAYLYLPGRVFRATRPSRSAARGLSWSPRAFDWDPEQGGEEGTALPASLANVVPVVRFCNRWGVGEFERHLPLLRRINRQILHRMSIVALQAFKQRAIKGVPLRDDQGRDIDYDSIFEAGPDALWLLPETAELWESGAVDLTPVLSAVREDVKHLAAVTRTPMHMLDPGGENQSAEGAALSRESLVFRVGDRIVRASDGWARVMSLAFRWMNDERADLDRLQVMWAPAERYSLAERGSAAAQLAAVAPQEWIWSRVLQAAPDEVLRMQSQRADQALLAPEVTAAQRPAPAPVAFSG